MTSALIFVKGAARRVGLGRLALKLYYRPFGLLRASIAEGGPLQQRRTEQGRLAMIEAARQLPSLVAPQLDLGATIAFLSGAGHWHQTAFCFASLQRVSDCKITPVVFDDGSFTADTRGFLARIAPWTEFVSSADIEQRLDECIPKHKFPTLRARRLEYPHLKKLTDLHAGGTGWTMVLDSDMLFFRTPEVVLNWFKTPRAIYMQDVGNAYGYPDTFLAELANGPVPERVNVGLYGIDSSSIDWDRVEHWCRRQLERFGGHYLQEQALTAMLLGRARATPLSSADYVVLPNLCEGQDPRAVLHHYVAHSKRSYYQFGWRRIANEFTRAAKPAMVS